MAGDGPITHLENMDRISDRLKELIDRMKASDARMQAQTEEFISTAKRDLEKMRKLIEEE